MSLPGTAFAHPDTSKEFAGSGETPSGAEADQLLVGFRSGTSSSERAAIHDDADTNLDGRLSAEQVDVVSPEQGQTVDEAIESYSTDPDVAFVEPNSTVSISGSPNDPFYTNGDQWALNNTGKNGATLDADTDFSEALSLFGDAATVGDPWPSNGSLIGVIDTGADLVEQPDLQGQGKLGTQCGQSLNGAAKVSMLSQCVDPNGHGTHVLGIIDALTNNGVGSAGIAFGAKGLPCRAIGADGSGTVADVSACINWMLPYKPSVISLSLGGSTKSQTLETAINTAYASGILVVASAGNDGSSVVSYPAGYENVIGVGAIDDNGKRASFSNYSLASVSVTAPGVNILSTLPGANWGYASGTSMAAPYAAGVLSDINWKTGKTGASLKSALISSVDDRGAPGRDAEYGYGSVNLCKALGGGASACSAPANAANKGPTAVFSISNEQPTAGETITVDASQSTDPDGSIVTYDWDFSGDGEFKATGEVAEVSYSAEGSYKITLTTTDSNGLTSESEQSIKVSPAGIATMSSLRLAAKVSSKMKLADLLKHGIKVRCSVDAAANCDVTARVATAKAKRIGLKAKKGSKYVVLGENDSDLEGAGTRAVTVKVAKRHRATLLKARKITIDLKVVATDEDGNESVVNRTLSVTNSAKQASKQRKR